MLLAAAVISAAVLAIIFLARPRLCLPAYLMLLPITPQVSVGGVPICFTSAVFALGLMGFLFSRAARGGYTLRRTPLTAPTLVFLASLLFSAFNAWALWGDHSGMISFLKLTRVLEVFAVLFLATELWATGSEKELRVLLQAVFIGAIGGAVLGLISVVRWDFLYGLNPDERYYGFQITVPGFVLNRAVGAFADPNHLSSYLSMVLLLCAVVWTKRELAINRLLMVVTMAACAAALLMTFSRAGWLSVLLSFGIYLLISPDYSRRKKLRIALSVMTVLLICAVTVSYMMPGMRLGLIARVMDTMEQFSSGQWNSVTSGRVSVWSTVSQVVQEYPFFGVGYKMLPERFIMGDNNYLTMLAEGGIVGTLIWAFWLLAMTISVYNLSKRHWLGHYLLAVWLALLINMTTADVMTYWRTLPLFFALLGATTMITVAKRSAKLDG